jgi:hypothetical protein
MDAESPWHWRDLRPAATFGLSLSSPSGNFYFGGSSEIRRNVQITYGFTVAKTSKLAPGSAYNSSGSPTTSPSTISIFGKGAYIGISYNISGFLQTLFGSSSKGGS